MTVNNLRLPELMLEVSAIAVLAKKEAAKEEKKNEEARGIEKIPPAGTENIQGISQII